MPEIFKCITSDCTFETPNQDEASAHALENPEHFIAFGVKG